MKPSLLQRSAHRIICAICISVVFQNPSVSQTWQSVGPHVLPKDSGAGPTRGLGRVNVIRFHPDYNGTSNKIIFAGSSRGGAWKTTNGGDSWSVMNTDQLPVLGVCDIAVRPDTPYVIFIATVVYCGSESLRYYACPVDFWQEIA